MTNLFDELNHLVKERLVRRKDYDNGLCIFKYQPVVHWKNLWHVSPALLRARGIVFTKEGEQVNNPLPKLFYVGENGTKVHRDAIVTAQRKVNGFYASVTGWKGQAIVATTGTLDSQYVQWAKETLMLGNRLEEYTRYGDGGPYTTDNYEIVHVNDPHIVPEFPGAYGLGIFTSADKVSEILYDVRFSDIVQFAKKVKHEGFVIYDDTHEPICKIKSPYYLNLKLMARMKDWKITAETTRDELRTRVDEEYYPLIDHIYDVYGADKFAGMHEQERLEMMREFIDRETLTEAVFDG